MTFDNSFIHSVMVDEKYLLVASHVDATTKQRIQNFEYIDLARLLPKDKLQQEDDQRLTFVNKGGHPWLVPASEVSAPGSISSYLKWHQAFRIYSDILTSRHPHKANELFQYEHVIHAASQNYQNVYAYDKDFRLHISQYPQRTWAIILQQAYSMRLKDKLRSDNNYFAKGSGNNVRKEECRLFQKGKCNYGANCKYDHRCTVCNKFGHGAYSCRKRFSTGDRSYPNNRDREQQSDRYHYYRSDRSDRQDRDNHNYSSSSAPQSQSRSGGEKPKK